MFLPGHRSPVAHAECAGNPACRVEALSENAQLRTVGAEFWCLGRIGIADTRIFNPLPRIGATGA